MSTESTSASNSLEIYKQLEEYPWDTDKEYQTGLTAILGPDPSPSQIHDLTLRAQCYYLSRKKSIPINYDEYKAYLSSKPSSSAQPEILPQSTTSSSQTLSMANQIPLPSIDPPTVTPPHHTPSSEATSEATPEAPQKTAPYPPTFAQIVAMIQSGEPIPGIREIPDEISTVVSEPKLPKRRKPWEKDVPEDVIQGRAGGTFGDARDVYIEQELPEA